MASNREIELVVMEAEPDKVGTGYASMSRRIMGQLNIVPGDIIEIVGKRNTFAIAWPLRFDDNRTIIRIDGIIRRNAGVSICDTVKVHPASLKPASKVTLAPLDSRIPEDLLHHARSRIYERALSQSIPVNRGDIIQVPVGLGGRINLMVVSIAPGPSGIITDATEITIRSEPVKEEEIMVSRVTFEDIGDLEEAKMRIREIVELPLKHPELFKRLGIDPPRGVLLYGPPGTGKTLLAKAVASESGAHFITINGPEIMSKFYGESEARLREVFREAEENAPSIIFIDELDAIAPKRSEVTGEVEKRVVAQLLALMDGMKGRGQVIVIGATNRPDAIDPALRRPGRFDREIAIGMPDKRARKEIFLVHTRNMPLDSDVNLDELAQITHGFTGADIAALCREAAMRAIRRIFPQIDFKLDHIPVELLEKIMVTNQDFMDALKSITPSALREVYVEAPNVKWSDIGGLKSAKRELEEALIWPVKYPHVYERMGIEPPRGILLVGAPGTGKTMLAKAVATESGLNFISISGPEIYSKWVGESEKAIREVFRKARMGAPSIVFLDEVESIGAHRGMSEDEGVSERVLSQLLTEIDGFRNGGYVFVLAATNRPDLVDPALLRPGRFDRIILVNPPNVEERIEILQIYTRKTPLASDVDLKEIARRTEGYTGSDLKALVREAALSALREDMNATSVKMEHFIEAMNKIKPSINDQIIGYYVNWVNKARQLYASKPSPMTFL